MLQQGDVHRAVGLGNADPVTEVPDGFRGIASSPKSGDGRHPGIIPAFHLSIVHQGFQVPLAHHCIGQVQPGKLDLLGRIGPFQLLKDPVIKGPMVFKLQGADGVGDSFDGILNGMGIVVHRIDRKSVV